MSAPMSLPPGASRDNAGVIGLPVTKVARGCRGAACPAFARCGGRCVASASVDSYERALAAARGGLNPT